MNGRCLKFNSASFLHCISVKAVILQTNTQLYNLIPPFHFWPSSTASVYLLQAPCLNCALNGFKSDELR